MGKTKRSVNKGLQKHARDAGGMFAKKGKGGDTVSQQQRNVAARDVKGKRKLRKLGGL